MSEENKDKKKKEEKIQKVEPRLNCNFTKTFMEKYFDGSLGSTITDYVLEHLLTCKDCYNKYHKYGMSIGVSFNVREAAIKYVTEQAVNRKVCYSREALLRLGFGKDLEVACNQWSVAANRLDIEKLMNLQSFSDFVSEDFTVKLDNWDDDIESIHDFTKWFAKRIANVVDFLERCYALETTEVTLDKKKKKNKKESKKNEKS